MKLSLNIRFCLVLLGLSTFSEVMSQEGEDWKLYRQTKDTLTKVAANSKELNPQSIGNIQLFRSADISILDSLKRKYPTKPNGYRVQIFFGNRENAREKKVEFLKKYPEVGAYISYLAPNFRLRVGDFRSKLSCEKFKKEISQDFPASYIVKDKIEFLDFSSSEY